MRNVRRVAQRIAKVDELDAAQPLPAGIYRIQPADSSRIAKMDEYLVQIAVLYRVTAARR
jgi:hypothetical protein